MKYWTQDEMDYMQDSWGSKSQKAIAKKLGRSINSVRIKANRLGLGNMLEHGEYVTFNQLCLALNGGNFNSYQLTSWCENRGFPIKHKLIMERRIRVVYIDDFWEWAEKNRTFIDFSKLEEFVLGKEPEWVKNKGVLI